MNTKTEVTPLTRQQLCRFIGRQMMIIRSDRGYAGQVRTLEEVRETHAILSGRFGAVEYVDICPVLRPISAVTNAEWVAYFGVGCDIERDGIGVTGISVIGHEATGISLWDNGEMACMTNDGRGIAALFNFAPLIDYLDQLGVDVRGYLENGQAVLLTTLLQPGQMAD